MKYPVLIHKDADSEFEQKYKELRLKTFAVVSLGFEKIWGKLVD